MTNAGHRRAATTGLLLLAVALAGCGGGGGGGGPPPPPPPPPAAGRNDTVATATTLANGSFAASISPSGNPNTVFNPDEDYYRIVTTANSNVTVDIDAQVNGSPIDSVIEFVGANSVPLSTCIAPNFNSVCIHDDEQLGVVLDSLMTIRVVGATTFFVHVVDWRGDARPDLLYTINISGIN